MYGPMVYEFVLEDPNAATNIQMREARRAPFP